MRRFGVFTRATSSQTRAPISLYMHLYTKYNNGRGLGGPGRRENQSPVERVAISSGRVNVASGVGKSPHPPDRHHLDPDLSTIPVTAHGMTAVSFARGVFTLRATRATMSASSSPNSLGAVAIVETLKHGGYQSVVRTTLQQKVQARPQRLLLVTSLISRTHNQSRIKRSHRNCRRRCERR